MRSLSDADLLGLWERGIRRHPLDRALLVLAAVFPETPWERLADWPLGRRNQALARVRCHCFGPLLRAWTECVNCGEKLEFEMNAQLLAGQNDGENTNAEEPVSARNLSLRLPSSRDLARAVGEMDPFAGALRIAQSCLVEPNPHSKWSEEELSEIGERLALADPFAEHFSHFTAPTAEKTGKQHSTWRLFFGWRSRAGPGKFFFAYTLWHRPTVGRKPKSCRSRTSGALTYLEMAQS